MTADRPLTPAAFAARLNVSRETLARLEAYEALLRTWQTSINLVSANSLDDPWRRHFLDSGQLATHIGGAQSIVDLGSGAGFPGLVLAVMTDLPTTLVESDQRKAAFLREAVRICGAPVAIIAGRAETVPPRPADIVVARALAPVTKLLEIAERWVAPGGQCVFLKGARVKEELTDASRVWNINFELRPSLSDPRGRVLLIREFSRV